MASSKPAKPKAKKSQKPPKSSQKAKEANKKKSAPSHEAKTEGQPKHPGGRPTTYKEAFAKQAEKLCRLGATAFELAEFFEVSERTIYRWCNTHEEFCHSLKVGAEPVDDRVERSLLNRAVGYSFESEKVFNFQGRIVRAKTVEHVPPDSTAAIFWLKNRRPDLWRDRKEFTGKDGKDLIPESEMSLFETARGVAYLLRMGEREMQAAVEKQGEADHN